MRMNETDYRAWRMRLRQVTAALIAEVIAAGADHTQSGVVDILLDPDKPDVGFVTPHHGAVWVPEAQVQAALIELQAAGGRPRVQLLDGLYPPAFLASLGRLGLRLATEEPLLLLPLRFDRDIPPVELSARPVLTADDSGAWSRLAGDQPPLAPGAVDWLIGLNGVLVGAARFGAVGARAARLHVWRGAGPAESPDLAELLLTAACASSALGVDLLFAQADLPDDRAALRALGFRDTGALLTFEAVP